MPHHHPITAEPVWHSARRLFGHEAPDALLSWLVDDSSLTRRLQLRCPGRFRVRPQWQGWERPLPQEAQRLGIRRHRLCLVRQVFLYCGDDPLVFARTVIPLSTLSGSRRRLARLGSRPLGGLLFADPSMQRDPLELCRLRSDRYPFATAVVPLAMVPAELWGRRSVFRLGGHPLLVSEFFLPALSG